MPIAPNKDYTFGPLESDPDTGLPKLPEGMAWRVSKSNDTSVKLSVAYNQNDGNWGTYAPDHFIFTSPSSGALKSCAEILYERIREHQKEWVQVEQVVGLYPPNSL